ncbi:hypothetical protein I545_2160 [Mycobacterium kansasii 662]|nr:hypothetical protein I545_2160 [Mycobacterium kansasii 662]KEP40173.1 hypothetical protein MKSMC1_47360 [Mycobacterium kansasii]
MAVDSRKILSRSAASNCLSFAAHLRKRHFPAEQPENARCETATLH